MENAKTSNGWLLCQTSIFGQYYNDLLSDVEKVLDSCPDEEIINHPSVRLYNSIKLYVTDEVPKNPAAKIYRLGNTLTKEYKHWRRVKSGMPDRYRMFFRFDSKAPKVIIYAYFNGEGELRKKGDKHDIYTVFKKRLDRGEIPNCMEALRKEEIGRASCRERVCMFV